MTDGDDGGATPWKGGCGVSCDGGIGRPPAAPPPAAATLARKKAARSAPVAADPLATSLAAALPVMPMAVPAGEYTGFPPMVIEVTTPAGGLIGADHDSVLLAPAPAAGDAGSDGDAFSGRPAAALPSGACGDGDDNAAAACSPAAGVGVRSRLPPAAGTAAALVSTVGSTAGTCAPSTALAPMAVAAAWCDGFSSRPRRSVTLSRTPASHASTRLFSSTSAASAAGLRCRGRAGDAGCELEPSTPGDGVETASATPTALATDSAASARFCSSNVSRMRPLSTSARNDSWSSTLERTRCEAPKANCSR